MHDIEPYYEWRDYYIASEDSRSVFFRRKYSEFSFTHKVYNYYIHPQWDAFGSSTLYCKILYVGYDKQVAVIELIGEWNDTLHNDIMIFKEEIIDPLIHNGINKFILVGEQVMNFHGSDDAYYEQWAEDIREEDGWILAVNFLPHVKSEMRNFGIHSFIDMNDSLNEVEWRKIKPLYIHKAAEDWMIKAIGEKE